MKMGFINQNEIELKQPIVESNFTNAICYGQTGSGKTTGFILPNIENRIKLNHGILIYDFKGNFHEQIKLLASKYDKLSNVFEIGKPWGKKIDILNYATTNTLQSMFNSIGGHLENDYWQNSAYSLFENIYFLLKHFQLAIEILEQFDSQISSSSANEKNEKYYPTIKNIANITKSLKSLKKFFKDIDVMIKFMVDTKQNYLIEEFHSSITEQTIAKFMRITQKMQEYCDLLQEFHDIDTKENTNSGNNGVLQVLNNTIRTLSNNDIFNNNEFDIVNNLLKGKIIIIDVSSFNTQMLNFFNQSIYNRLIRQTSINDNRSSVTIFIDEAQKVINTKSMPDVDVCRENRFEFILSTQDRLLLEKQIGTANTEILLKNITSQYSFITTTRLDTAIDTSKLDKFEYVDMIADKKYKTSPMFLDKDDIFDIEYEYQSNLDALKLINFKSKSKFVLKYNPEIYEEYKALIYFKDNNQTKIVDIYFDTNELENKLEKFNDTKDDKSGTRFDLSKMEKLLAEIS